MAESGKEDLESAVIGEQDTWKATGFRRLASKNGEFSKTALVQSLAWLFVLFVYAPLCLLFSNTEINLGLFEWVVPAFDSSAVGMLLTLASGTYLGNNALKKKVSGTGGR